MPGRAVGERARLRLRRGDQVAHRGDARGGRDDEQHRLRAERRHVDQVLARVVRQVRVQRRVDRVARGMHEQHVAVGRRPRPRPRAIEPPAPGRFSIDDRLAPELGELAADGAGDDVGHAAGREGDHDAHRLRRKGLRGRARGQREQRAPPGTPSAPRLRPPASSAARRSAAGCRPAAASARPQASCPSSPTRRPAPAPW